ncbi:MAG: hypothetical protein EZS28_026886 [Streblomastix strix]|uniref:Protein kinase domain-containing protein n=1 Tax=Streblomastix strix TaxID=222440 RepID=A0A5J4V4Q6_9EUKA|nr:MAG: hypothetical protein EZS28_026886 [Streblomastix strix]
MLGLNQLSNAEKERLFQEDKQAIEQQLDLKNPEYLGAGSFGRVYRAESNDGAYLAVKVQSQEQYNNQEFAAADVLNTIPNNYFVKTFGKKDFGEKVFLLEEFCDLQSLESATNLGLIAKTSILMEFLVLFHEKGLVHCDITPSNILFSSVEGQESFIPKLGDFGETTSLQNINNSTEIDGTQFFFPPEVRQRRGDYNQGIDIWMLGMTLYMIASGKKIDHRSYGLLCVSGLVPPTQTEDLSKSQNELLLDVNGKKLTETMGKDFVHFLSYMLNEDPKRRLTAKQLLQHSIFTKNLTGNIDQIPNAYAEELGLKIDIKKQIASQRVSLV